MPIDAYCGAWQYCINNVLHKNFFGNSVKKQHPRHHWRITHLDQIPGERISCTTGAFPQRCVTGVVSVWFTISTVNFSVREETHYDFTISSAALRIPTGFYDFFSFDDKEERGMLFSNNYSLHIQLKFNLSHDMLCWRSMQCPTSHTHTHAWHACMHARTS